MPSIPRIKQHKLQLIARYAEADNRRGYIEALTTLVPIALLWASAAWCASVSWSLTALVTLLLTVFTFRCIVLMHECGHSSQFDTPWLNHLFGFLFGVVIGMPQYVWSKHHSYHHAHNGNWDAYRGPLTTSSTGEYAALSVKGQRRYRFLRNIMFLPLGGFLYLILNPRFTWIKGSLGLARHLLRQGGRTQPGGSLTTRFHDYKSPYWKTAKEYRHMTWNNVVLLSAWAVMCWAIGPLLFISMYLFIVSVAGAVGIALFAVQHNFEHSYASDGARWDLVRGAIKGTSYLVLPAWLNWITANSGYHHIHHLSARIPSYRLAQCHRENEELFADVPRVRLSQIRRALKCILWDIDAQRIISVDEYQQQLAGVH